MPKTGIGVLANGIPIKQIQKWLGHSDFSTTANIYAHLYYSSKIYSAEAMLQGLNVGMDSSNQAPQITENKQIATEIVQ